ncbi:hypothetical protein T492DRAFT_866514 [Pavlovales sp. CCMP2436]|nr:hypothetical protein T492DRAFT_866514 [Pavlovales sp. CCMP2436]
MRAAGEVGAWVAVGCDLRVEGRMCVRPRLPVVGLRPRYGTRLARLEAEGEMAGIVGLQVGGSRKLRPQLAPRGAVIEIPVLSLQAGRTMVSLQAGCAGLVAMSSGLSRRGCARLARSWALVLLSLSSAVAFIGPVDLGTAGGEFGLLSKAAITGDASNIIGDVGSSSAITLAELTMDSSGTYGVSTQVTGRTFAGSYAAPTPAMVTTALSDMDKAYADAIARPYTDSTFHNVMVGAIGGHVFIPGVYKFDTFVHIASDFYIRGSQGDHYLFKVTEYLSMAAAAWSTPTPHSEPALLSMAVS